MSDSKQEQFQKRYKEKATPWDIGRPDFNLIDIVSNRPIGKGKALDVGCGFGHNSLWLAQHGFLVTGVDVSEVALKQAEENASAIGANCMFLSLDFLQEDVPGLPFNFVFDRGCFHAYDSDDERKRFAERVGYHLDKSGLWLSLIGSTDEPSKGPGPPRRSARDIVVAVEPFFEILSLTASHFDSNSQHPPKAWTCLMRKR